MKHITKLELELQEYIRAYKLGQLTATELKRLSDKAIERSEQRNLIENTVWKNMVTYQFKGELPEADCHNSPEDGCDHCASIGREI